MSRSGLNYCYYFGLEKNHAVFLPVALINYYSQVIGSNVSLEMKGTELVKIIHSSVIVGYISKPCSQGLEPNRNKRWVTGKEELNHFAS